MKPTIPPSPDDIRPKVARTASKRAPWLFGAGLALSALLLFLALEARRASFAAPSTLIPAESNGGVISSPPELKIPAEPRKQISRGAFEQSVPTNHPLEPPPGSPQVPERFVQAPQYPEAPRFPPPSYDAPALPPPPFSAPREAASTPAAQTSRASRSAIADDPERAHALPFANPSTTIPKGIVMHAVLESALDSSRGGLARAVISRDVYSFDGSKILVPRGSRILGEYRSDATAAQNRVLIEWDRLMRPDGIMINIASPSADPLGRAGVRGNVDTHFFERFGGAILQSALDVGVQLAGRAASRDTVVVTLPGSIQQGTQVVRPAEIAPTITVRQGTSVSVFVARDLDFTAVEE